MSTININILYKNNNGVKNGKKRIALTIENLNIYTVSDKKVCISACACACRNLCSFYRSLGVCV